MQPIYRGCQTTWLLQAVSPQSLRVGHVIALQAILAAAGKGHVLGDMNENDEDADEEDDADEDQDDGGLSEAVTRQAVIC